MSGYHELSMFMELLDLPPTKRPCTRCGKLTSKFADPKTFGKDVCKQCAKKIKQERDQKYRRTHVAYQLWLKAKKRAKKLGLPFTITVQHIEDLIPVECPILHHKLVLGNREEGYPWSPSLDRIYPNLGYVPDNIIVISFRANTLKNDSSPGELALVVKQLDDLWNLGRDEFLIKNNFQHNIEMVHGTNFLFNSILLVFALVTLFIAS